MAASNAFDAAHSQLERNFNVDAPHSKRVKRRNANFMVGLVLDPPQPMGDCRLRKLKRRMVSRRVRFAKSDLWKFSSFWCFKRCWFFFDLLPQEVMGVGLKEFILFALLRRHVRWYLAKNLSVLTGRRSGKVQLNIKPMVRNPVSGSFGRKILPHRSQ